VTAVPETGPEEDLRYVPPPRRPALSLHAARMTPARLVEALGRSLLPSASLARLGGELRRSAGVADAVLTASGRAALRLALDSLGAGPGREVVLSTFNCPAVVDAVIATGARPVLVDFSARTGPAFHTADLDGRIVVLTNGLGLDEWTEHAASLTARGAEVVLDLAQALLSPGLLRRFRPAPCPVVLSFGPGKPLGGIGGGALLHPGGAPARPPALRRHPGGVRALWAAFTARALLSSPAAVRAAAQRRRERAPGWSLDKADHLPTAPGAVHLRPPSRWEVGAADALWSGAEAGRRRAAALHEEVRRAVGTELSHVRLLPSDPDLTSGIELLVRHPGDRQAVAAALARRGIPSTWNYYPLHRMAPYRQYAAGPLTAVDEVWPRVLTVPKLAQPRLDSRLMADALREADATVRT